MNWVVNGLYTIPETKEGVANLWFFIEGNEVLNQLITDDAREALIQAKLGTVNTKQLIALVNEVEDYMNQELRTDLVELRISLASSELAAELVKDRVERILSKIEWDIRKRGLVWTAHNLELRELFFKTANPNSGGLDDAMIDAIGMKVSDYLRGDSADIQVESERVISAIITGMDDALRLSISGERSVSEKTPEWSEKDIVGVLKKNVPQTLYADDPKALDYAAETIVAIIKDEINWARVKRLIQDIKPFLPESLSDDEKFLGNLRDDVWEINEDRMAIEGSKYDSLSGNTNAEARTKLSAQQTGMPIIYNDLDRNIMESQALSLSIAILLVFLLLAFRLKSLIGGLISITPIVLTILINFMIMAIFNIPLDVVTVLIGSVAVGIGIDYTIHFVTRFKVEHARGKTELEALDKTLETTGKAIVINALSVMMGFLVLVLGNIVPMQRFGYLIALTMIISATASITVLPALLLVTRTGFIGRLGLLTNGLVSKVANKINTKNTYRKK
jgi:hypothetical protein